MPNQARRVLTAHNVGILGPARALLPAVTPPRRVAMGPCAARPLPWANPFGIGGLQVWQGAKEGPAFAAVVGTRGLGRPHATADGIGGVLPQHTRAGTSGGVNQACACDLGTLSTKHSHVNVSCFFFIIITLPSGPPQGVQHR